jgi:hypothetical protein
MACGGGGGAGGGGGDMGGAGGTGGKGKNGGTNGTNGGNGTMLPGRSERWEFASLNPRPSRRSGLFESVSDVRANFGNPDPTKSFNDRAGRGGDGALVLAAPLGVFISGRIDVGYRGSVAIYGPCGDANRFQGIIPSQFSHQDLLALPAHEFVLFGGSGGGGGGGDGHLVMPDGMPIVPFAATAFPVW